MGRRRFRGSRRLLIVTDCIDGDKSAARAWRIALQDLAAELDLTLEVPGLPLGTSKRA
jgi:hypothetical protein